MHRILTGALLLALTACGATSPAGDASSGKIVAVVKAVTSRGSITRVNVSVLPAGVSSDLTYNAGDGTFSGTLVVAAGVQTVTGTAYMGDTVVGTGSGEVTVSVNETAAVYLVIRDNAPPDAVPDHGPLITSVVVSNVEPVVNEHVTLAATAEDVDPGDTVAYAWSQNCSGTFSAQQSATTEWWSAGEGACTLSLTVTSNGLSETRGVQLVVYPLTGRAGTLEVTGLFVERPRIESVSVTERAAGPRMCVVERSGTDATCHLGVFATEQLLVDVMSSDLAKDGATVGLTSSCGGVIAPSAGNAAQFEWTTPDSPAVCTLTATVTRHGLTDDFPVAILAGCRDDRFEHNDTRAAAARPQATNLMYAERALYADDDDWFQVSLPQGGVRISATSGDVPLAIALAAADGTVIANGTGLLIVEDQPAIDLAYVRIGRKASAVTGCGVAYDLSVQPYGIVVQTGINWVDAAGNVTIEHRAPTVMEAFDASGSRYEGNYDGAGTVLFPGVPLGVTMVHVGSVRYQTSARVLDFTVRMLGRSSATAATVATLLTVDMSGLDPIVATADGAFTNAQIDLFDTNGTYAYATTIDGLVAGSTTASATYDWSLSSGTRYLHDSAAGDEAWLFQYEQRTAADSTPYTIAVRAGRASPFTMQDGVPAAATATLSPLALRSWTPILPVSLLSPDPVGRGPGAIPNGGDLTVWSDRWEQSVLVSDLVWSPTSAPTNLGTLEFGDVSDEPAGVSALALFSVPFTAPGATTPYRMTVYSATETTVAASGETVIPAFIGPPLGITVDGVPGDVAGTCSATPSLSWSAVPGANSYHVSIREVRVGLSSRTTYSTVGTVYTADPSVRIPAGLLSAGKSYVFIVTASTRAANRVAYAFPQSVAQAASAMFTVQ